MEETFECEIDRLAALQEFDRRLKDQQEQVAVLVGEADVFETELARQRGEVANLIAEQEGLEAQHAEMDARLEGAAGKIRDNRMRLSRIRNNMEYLALQREIDMGKEANQQLEEEILTVMENLEAVGPRLAEAQGVLQGLEEQVGVAVEGRRSQAEELRLGLAAERSRRDALAQGMDPALRSKYEQIFERRGGTAVVEVRQEICLGCHMNVPPQLFNELQRLRTIHQCPNCHRILYWRPEGASDESRCSDV